MCTSDKARCLDEARSEVGISLVLEQFTAELVISLQRKVLLIHSTLSSIDDPLSTSVDDVWQGGVEVDGVV